MKKKKKKKILSLTCAHRGDDDEEQRRPQGPHDPRAEEADYVPPVPARGAVGLPLGEVEVGAAVPLIFFDF